MDFSRTGDSLTSLENDNPIEGEVEEATVVDAIVVVVDCQKKDIFSVVDSQNESWW